VANDVRILIHISRQYKLTELTTS